MEIFWGFIRQLFGQIFVKWFTSRNAYWTCLGHGVTSCGVYSTLALKGL